LALERLFEAVRRALFPFRDLVALRAALRVFFAISEAPAEFD
jgi:hypothetical protein